MNLSNQILIGAFIHMYCMNYAVGISLKMIFQARPSDSNPHKMRSTQEMQI